MRYFLSLMLFLFLPVTLCKSYSIVFVYIGKQLPSYVDCAIKQARLFNHEDDAEIVLLINKSAEQSLSQEIIEQNKVTIIHLEDLEKTENHAQFLNKSRLDARWNNGYWRACTERFFCLHEYMQQYQVSDVFQLECDNMLYVNLKDLLPVFHRYKNIAATFEHNGRCIPGFMYCAKPDSFENFVNFLARIAHKGLEDTWAVGLYNLLHFSDEIDHLPVIMPEYIIQHGIRSIIGFNRLFKMMNGLKSFKSKRHFKQKMYENSHDFYKNIDAFGGIFDGNMLGQYLGGLDPNYHANSSPGHINPHSRFDASKLTYEWRYDDQGRNIPHAGVGDHIYPIYSLHVHNKKLSEFAS